MVTADEAGPAFAFTIGLFHNYGHPEIILFGLQQEVAHSVLNLIGAAVKSGQRFRTGERSREFLEQHECAFVAFPIEAYHDYLGYARWFYTGDEFPALQCVWADVEGMFPWDAGVNNEFKARQPMPGQTDEVRSE